MYHLRKSVVYIIRAAPKSDIGRVGGFWYNGGRWDIPG
jgi:hypothetical protein